MNNELLLEFFLTFSRFEFALKATGLFVRGGEEVGDAPDAKPDWDTFAGRVAAFDRNATDELRLACEYLADSPPHKQVILNGGVGWETRGRAEGEAEIRFLLRMVRAVRNNLFHGGKYRLEVHESTDRTEMLVRSSLVLLRACLAIAREQDEAFQTATLV